MTLKGLLRTLSRKKFEHIVQKAKAHNCQASYYYGKGYNAVAGNPRDGFTRKEEVDYSNIIREIEQWINNYVEFWKRIKKD